MKITRNKTDENNIQTITILLDNGAKVDIIEDGDVANVKVNDYNKRKYKRSLSSVGIVSSGTFGLNRLAIHTNDSESNQIKRANRFFDDFDVTGIEVGKTDISIYHDK